MTDRKLAGEGMASSELSLHAVTQASNDGIISAGEDGRIRFWNPAAETIFGLTPEEAIGEPLTILMPERYREVHRRGLARLQATGEAKLVGKATVQLHGLRRDGTEFPLELSLGSWESDGREHYTGIVRDVTQRERAERYFAAQFAVARALAEAPTFQAAAAALLPALGQTMDWTVGGVWMVDEEAGVIRLETFWHDDDRPAPSFEKASRETVLPPGRGLPGRVWESGQPLWVPDVLVDEHFARTRAAAEDGLHAAICLPLTADYGTIGVLEFFSPEVHEPDEGLLDTLATIGDQIGQFAQRKRTQAMLAATNRELEKRAEELQRSNAELEQFAYVASHDLTEPLRMVSSFVRLLETRYADQLDQDAREFISFAVDGVVRMQELIDDLLAYSRVGRQPLQCSSVDTGRLVEGVLRELEPAIAQRAAEVTVGELPTILADAGQLHQVFLNLIGNAVKFVDDRSPQVSVQAERADGAWRFEVADNGIGIEPHHAERIFTMFQRLHGRDAYPGTGIGLAICQRVVERHGGEIGVRPAPGGGSVLSFTIPQQPGGSP